MTPRDHLNIIFKFIFLDLLQGQVEAPLLCLSTTKMDTRGPECKLVFFARSCTVSYRMDIVAISKSTFSAGSSSSTQSWLGLLLLCDVGQTWFFWGGGGGGVVFRTSRNIFLLQYPPTPLSNLITTLTILLYAFEFWKFD